MHIDYEQDRHRYRVRWREDGRYRSRRFKTQEEAERFAASISEPPTGAPLDVAARPGGDGVYEYSTSKSRRWRSVFRQSDRMRSRSPSSTPSSPA
jgi:hypothetical protein